MGVGSVRPLRGHHVLPLRSDTIPVSLVSALAKNGAPVSLVPLRVKPTIDRVKAISNLLSWGDRKGRLQRIWLVYLRHGTGRERLAWMAVTLHTRVSVYGCDGKKCKQWYTSPLASFLDARTGRQIEALTINGWKPQLPPPGRRAPALHRRHRPQADPSTSLAGGSPHGSARRPLRRFHAVTAVTCLRRDPYLPRTGSVGGASSAAWRWEASPACSGTLSSRSVAQPAEGSACAPPWLVGFPVAILRRCSRPWRLRSRVRR